MKQPSLIAAILLGGVILTAAGFARASCTCGFTDRQRAVADKELWLSKKDKSHSIEQNLPRGLPRDIPGGYAFQTLVQRDYVIGYSTDLVIPLWTAYQLTKKTLDARQKAKKAAGADRKNCFRADPRLNNGQTATCPNYDEPVFDQGHLVPDADMPPRPVASLVNSYIFSNITPQHCHFNRGIWLFLEGAVREWARSNGGVYVISGSAFDSDEDGNPDPASRAVRLKANKFGAAPAVPTHFYKVVLHETREGLEAIAILLPHNNDGMTRQEAKEYLKAHITTIDAIEKLAGIDLPPNVKKSKSSPEEAVERFLAPTLWELEAGLPPTFDAACK